MTKIIAVHSYKGGTGKTSMSVNLAASFAKAGKKVCVFDLDFRAPSLFAILKAQDVEYWFNDYLNNSCEINSALIDMSSRISGGGKFYAALLIHRQKLYVTSLQKTANGKCVHWADYLHYAKAY
jgi:septum site-determining protein MinD